MSIYYFAVDHDAEKQFWAPDSYSFKAPGIFAPGNPFPNMLVMMNMDGYNFEVINDMIPGDGYSYEDITKAVYADFLKRFPDVD